MHEKKYLSPIDITIIVIVFLQYRCIGDLFITIPRYNDVILPVPLYIVISGLNLILTHPIGFETHNKDKRSGN